MSDYITLLKAEKFDLNNLMLLMIRRAQYKKPLTNRFNAIGLPPENIRKPPFFCFLGV